MAHVLEYLAHIALSAMTDLNRDFVYSESLNIPQQLFSNYGQQDALFSSGTPCF